MLEQDTKMKSDVLYYPNSHVANPISAMPPAEAPASTACFRPVTLATTEKRRMPTVRAGFKEVGDSSQSFMEKGGVCADTQEFGSDLYGDIQISLQGGQPQKCISSSQAGLESIQRVKSTRSAHRHPGSDVDAQCADRIYPLIIPLDSVPCRQPVSVEIKSVHDSARLSTGESLINVEVGNAKDDLEIVSSGLSENIRSKMGVGLVFPNRNHDSLIGYRPRRASSAPLAGVEAKIGFALSDIPPRSDNVRDGTMSSGFIFPNSTSLALRGHDLRRASSASRANIDSRIWEIDKKIDHAYGKFQVQNKSCADDVAGNTRSPQTFYENPLVFMRDLFRRKVTMVKVEHTVADKSEGALAADKSVDAQSASGTSGTQSGLRRRKSSLLDGLTRTSSRSPSVTDAPITTSHMQVEEASQGLRSGSHLRSVALVETTRFGGMKEKYPSKDV